MQLKAKAYKKRQVDGTKNATQTFLWRHQNRSLSARSVDGNDAKCCEQFVLWNGSPLPAILHHSFPSSLVPQSTRLGRSHYHDD